MAAVVIECHDCGATVTLPGIGNDRVSIAPLSGWTAPPLRCPRCTADRDALLELAGEWNVDLDDPDAVAILERSFAYAAKRLAIARRDFVDAVRRAFR